MQTVMNRRTLWMTVLTALIWMLAGLGGTMGRGTAENVVPMTLVSHAGEQPVSSAEAQWHHQPGQRQQQALLSDARQAYRVCHSRQQRVLPSHGSPTERPAGGSRSVWRYVSPLSSTSFFDGRRRMERSPFQASSARFYYVIALRRLLC